MTRRTDRASHSGARRAAADELRLLHQRLAVCQDELELLAQTAAESTHELEISRQRYADLYDLAPIGYASLDRTGVIREVNLAGAALLGRERRHVVGRPLLPLVAKPDHRKWHQHLVQCNTKPGRATTELTLVLRGGRHRTVQVCSQRSIGLDGQPNLLTTLDDITARREAEEAVRRHYALLTATNRILAEAPLARSEGELGSICLNVTQEFTESPFGFIGEIGADGLIHRLAASEAGGGTRRKADRDTPSDRLALPEIHRRALLEGRSVVVNDLAPHADTAGSRPKHRPVTALIAAPFRLDGKSVGVVALGNREGGYSREHLTLLEALAPSFTESFARKRAEWRLAETTQRLEALLRALPVGVSFSMDPTCREITGNDALFAQFEMNPRDSVSASAPDPAASGRRVRYFRDGQEVSAAELPLQRAAAKGQPIPPMELEVELPSGRRWFAEISGAPVADGQGRVIGGVAVTLDVTERKRSEAALARHQAWDEAKVAIGAAAVSGEPLDAVLMTAVDAVVRAAGAPVALLRLADPETRDLVLVAERNVPPSYRQVAGRIRWGERLAGEVARTGRAKVADDLSEQPRRPLLGYLSDPPIVALVCVPLMAQGQALGTLALGHPQARHFDAIDVAEINGCADMLAGAIRAERLREELRREADVRALLLRELDHRVRNTLATLIGLLHLTAEEADAPTAAVLHATADRVSRLADVHAALAEQGQRRADLGQLAEMVAKSVLDVPTAAGPIRWSIDVPPIDLRSAQATTITLVLHELFTNCVKHAFRGIAGMVWVEGRRDGQDVHLAVCNDGRAVSPTRIRNGTGLTIVETLVTHTLRGALWLAETRDGGFLVHIRFPLAQAAEPGEPS